MGNVLRISARATARHPVNIPADSPNTMTAPIPRGAETGNREKIFPAAPPKITAFAVNTFELDKDAAGSWCSMLLVLLSVLLTGFNIYPSIANWGGAGALVPITGFANSVAAPAIEFQKEGQVFGIGCKIFTIAGPVILYGIFTSWALGLIYWLGQLMGIF